MAAGAGVVSAGATAVGLGAAGGGGGGGGSPPQADNNREARTSRLITDHNRDFLFIFLLMIFAYDINCCVKHLSSFSNFEKVHLLKTKPEGI